MIDFTIVDWAAWAPGLHDREDWLAWAQRPTLPDGDDTPPLSEVRPMQRRRIERMGRMAVQAAWWCSRAEAEGVPSVFASRHGDVQRSFELLTQLANEEQMSPTSFGLSVHNAIAALYSIVRGERGNYVSLAAGRATAEAAVIEAAGLLADGAKEVLVVNYDGPLPSAYEADLDEPTPYYAWSWRLGTHAPGARISLAWRDDSVDFPASSEAPTNGLPAGLDALRFVLDASHSRTHRCDGLCWTWQRHE